MRTRRLIHSQGFGNYARREAWQSKIAFVRDAFRKTDRPVPGVNATIKWLLGRARKKAAK